MSSAGNWGAPSWHSLAAQYNVPTSQAQLYQGLAKQAVDPTTAPMSTNPTSMARISVPGQTSAQMGDASGAISTNATAQPAGVTAPASGLLAQSLISAPAAVSRVATAAPAASSVSTPAYRGVGPVQTAASQVQYGGAQVVAVPTGAGSYNYYNYDPATQSYTLLGNYNPKTHTGSGATYGQASIPGAGSAGSEGIGGALPNPLNGTAFGGQTIDGNGTPQGGPTVQLTPGYVPTADQLAQATYLGQLGTSPNDPTGANAVDNYYKDQIDKYGNAVTAANAQMDENARQSQISIALDWMENHGGQAPPGGNLSSDVVSEAQSQYQAEMAGGQRINGSSGMAPIDTSAVDKTNALSLAAQYSANSNLFGGSDAVYNNRLASMVNQAQEGANANQHQTAAAASFNTNLKAFTDAVTAQTSLDTNATGAKLNSDIMQISDFLNTISQQAGQLGAEGQQNVNTAVSELQSAMNQYQQAVQEHGVNSQFAMSIAGSILKGAAAISSGGATSVASAAAGALQ